MAPPFEFARWLTDIKVCLGLLTRFPVTGDARDDTRGQLAQASWAFPVVGALIGAIGAAVFAVASAFGLPPWTAALLAVGATIAASGGLHEDGLADVADGFGGAVTRDDKLAIMGDSRIGTYGTLALILSVALRAAALAAIADPWTAAAALIAAHAGARACLPVVMHVIPLAKAEGLAARAGMPDSATVAIAGGLAAITALVLLGFGTGIIAIAAAATAAAAMAVIARQQIGGYSGDVLGAVQQCAEIALLLAVASA